MNARRPRRTVHLIATCACVAGTLSAGAVALAQQGASAKVKIAPNTVASATAECPQGTGVVAGGFDSPDFVPAAGGPGVARIGSQRTGAGSLRTRGFNFGGVAGELESLAYCSKQGRSVRVASDKVFVGPNTAGVAIATCPRNTEVVAGGFANPGWEPEGSRVLTVTSKRAGQRRWRVEGFSMGNDGNNDPNRQALPGTLVSYAYCLEDAPTIVTRQKRKSAGEKGQTKTLNVPCPGGTRALSGGFDGNLSFTNTIKGSGAITSRRADHGTAWRIHGLSVSDGPAKMTAYAYCVAAKT